MEPRTSPTFAMLVLAVWFGMFTTILIRFA